MHAKRKDSANHLMALPSMTDDDLVRLAHADIHAFAPLYERYARPIHAFCYRRLNHPEDAADAATLVFTRALAGINRFQPDPTRTGSTFRAWLYTIARNVLTDLHRTRRASTSLDGMTCVHLADPAQGPEQHAMDRDDAETVHRILSNLPERQRQIVELRLAGLTMPEISTSLSMTESAARSLQVRAYRTLRDLVASASTEEPIA